MSSSSAWSGSGPASTPTDAGDPAANAPPPGTVIGGKYRVESLLGSGGMGIVVRATHLHLGEPVALKLLRPEVARSEAAVERFLREARASVRIHSEHVARVFDVGTLPSGEPFMVMELLEGDDLNQVGRDRGPLPVRDAVDYVIQACRAIVEAHHQGIVHRDLKPANLFLTRRGDGSPLVKVLDFGISKVIDGSDQTLTTTADVLGSPLYMSPEQIRDARGVDGRSDIWALGNILYRLLVGRAPFAADSSAATLARIIADPPMPLRDARSDVSPELDAIVARCLEKSPEKRFQYVEELITALSGLGSSSSTVAAPMRAPLGGLTIVMPLSSGSPPRPSYPTISAAGEPVERPIAPQETSETTGTGSSVTTQRPAGPSRQAVYVTMALAVMTLTAFAALGVRLTRRSAPAVATSTPTGVVEAPLPSPTAAGTTEPAPTATSVATAGATAEATPEAASVPTTTAAATATALTASAAPIPLAPAPRRPASSPSPKPMAAPSARPRTR